MRTFFTLFKHERRTLFPAFTFKKKPDVIGGLLSLIVSLLVAATFLLLVYAISDSYTVIKIDKVSDPTARSLELLNALYSIVIIGLSAMLLEKMRVTLISTPGKQIFLRLPVSQTKLFSAKLSALAIWNYATAACLLIPISVIFYFVLKPQMSFWLNTALVVLFLPMASFLIATLLLIPYIKIIDFLSSKYILTFVTLTAILVASFFAYSKFLGVLQNLFETGSIKFLFNQEFVEFLQTLEKYTYPANSLSNILLGQNMKDSLFICLGVSLVSALSILIIAKRLYTVTLYKNKKKARRGSRRVGAHGPMASLMKKEFITVFREPKHLFSYFAIAIAMPFMVYCCYTLFDTLIFNAIGLSFKLSLAIIVVLIFNTLTNTFCATNITRDGVTALKAKIFPIKPQSTLAAKIIFCNIISSLSVIASSLVLLFTHELGVLDALIVMCLGLIFSVSQVLLATRMDLNHAKLTASTHEITKSSNQTIAKTITIGLFFAIVIGFLSLFISVFAGTSTPDFLNSIEIKKAYTYLIPLAVALIYLAISITYYSVKLERAFEKLVR